MPTWQQVQQNPSLFHEALLDGEGDKFHWHSHATSPHSSQIICVSAFGTLRRLSVKNAVLEGLLNTQDSSVACREWQIQLEHEAPQLLNECGPGQPSSIDALFTCPASVVCLEAKFLTDAKEGFGSCSQPKTTKKRPIPSCAGHHGPQSDQKTRTKACCRLEVWDGDRSPRLYWSLGRAFFQDSVFAEQKAGEVCPFNGPHFQLMRNFLVAAAYAQRHKKQQFGVVVVAPQATSDKLTRQVEAFQREVLLPEHAGHIRLTHYETYIRLLRDSGDEAAGRLAEFLEQKCLSLVTL